jgi:hypothetical protein
MSFRVDYNTIDYGRHYNSIRIVVADFFAVQDDMSLHLYSKNFSHRIIDVNYAAVDFIADKRIIVRRDEILILYTWSGLQLYIRTIVFEIDEYYDEKFKI